MVVAGVIVVDVDVVDGLRTVDVELSTELLVVVADVSPGLHAASATTSANVRYRFTSVSNALTRLEVPNGRPVLLPLASAARWWSIRMVEVEVGVRLG